MLRKLLVSGAHYILGPFGSDSDLRRHGEKDGLSGRQERQEASGGGHSEEACGALAQLVGYRSGLRSAPQRASARKKKAGGDRLETKDGAQKKKPKRR